MGFDVRKPALGVYDKQRYRPACASAQSDQCLCTSLIAKYHIRTSYKQNFTILGSRPSCADGFGYDLIGNPEDRFSHIATHKDCEKHYVCFSVAILRMNILKL